MSECAPLPLWRKEFTKAVHMVGGQSAMARAMDNKQGYVRFLLTEAKRFPENHVEAVESATNGEVTRHHLCPDIFGTPEDIDSHPENPAPIPVRPQGGQS